MTQKTKMETKSLRSQNSFIFSLIAAVLLIILALQNSGNIEMRFYLWKVEAPLMLSLFLAALLGALITWLLSFSGHRQIKKELKESRKKLESQSQALQELKQELKRMRDSQPNQPSSAAQGKA